MFAEAVEGDELGLAAKIGIGIASLFFLGLVVAILVILCDLKPKKRKDQLTKDDKNGELCWIYKFNDWHWKLKFPTPFDSIGRVAFLSVMRKQLQWLDFINTIESGSKLPNLIFLMAQMQVLYSPLLCLFLCLIFN